MGRPGTHVPGHPLHVVRRSEEGQPLFHLDAERSAFLERIGRALRTESCALHAYVLMGNHLHLLLTPGWARAVPRLMASLWQSPWRERFDAWPVHPRSYVLACMRYIELNPVRAGMVRWPGDYRWSSYGANALGDDDALLTPHALYGALGRSIEERRRAYRESFRGAMRLKLRRPRISPRATT